MPDEPITAKDRLTLLLAIYKENADQARHHEVQRERVTALVGQASGVVLGLLGGKAALGLGSPNIPLVAALFLMVLGLWGYFASSRHYERSRLHVQRLREVRLKLEVLTLVALGAMNDLAEREHEKVFNSHAFRYRRTHVIWNAFHLLVAALGLILVLQIEPLFRCCA